MNLETLLEAAKFVELQEVKQKKALQTFDAREEYSAVVIKQEGVVPYYQPPPAEKPRSNAQTRENEADDHHSYHRDSSREGDHDVHDLRRRFGAGTREVHNKLEKNRRAHLKECFELVKKQLPASHEKKASNLNILHSALRFIQTLRRKEREYEHEMERLAREKIALQQRFATLKKELSAQWDHIDFNTLIPDVMVVDSVHRTHSSAVSEQEDVMVTSDSEEALHRRGLIYSSTSSLSSAATASASPLLPHSLPAGNSDDRHSPRSNSSPKNLASREDIPKLISLPNRRESPKQPTTTSPHSKSAPTSVPSQTSGHHLQLPVSTPILSTAPGHIAATIVSPTIQLVTSSGIRMLPNDQSLALSLSHPNSVTSSGVALVHKPNNGDSPPDALSLIQTNGIRSKSHPIGLAIQNGALAPGLTAKNGTIYKQQTQVSESLLPTHLTSAGITHVVAPIPGAHGTLVTPVPVTVVSQGSQVAHILTASPQLGNKIPVTPLSLKPVSSMPMMGQYIVKPGAAMVVVSQASTVPHSTA